MLSQRATSAGATASTRPYLRWMETLAKPTPLQRVDANVADAETIPRNITKASVVALTTPPATAATAPPDYVGVLDLELVLQHSCFCYSRRGGLGAACEAAAPWALTAPATALSSPAAALSASTVEEGDAIAGSFFFFGGGVLVLDDFFTASGSG